MPWQTRFGLLAALAIGLLNTTGFPILMCLSLVAPVLCSLQPTRHMAARVISAYYLGCTWPVCVVLYNYYGTIPALLFAPVICAAIAGLLALPFAIAWSPVRRVAATRLAFAVVASALPPLGIIGIGSPLAVAGILFPGGKWFGLISTLVLPPGLLLKPKVAIAVAASFLAIFHARFDTPVPPSDWAGLSTRSCSGQRVECDYERFLAIQRRSSSSYESVLVFPEAAVENWNAATELFWQDTNEILRRRGATVLIGATVRQGHTSRNEVLIRGAETGSFTQRVPVPIAMWRPFDGSAVPLNLTGPATVVVQGKRVAILICYEQLIPWTWISAVVEEPDALVAVSNDEWSHGTTLPEYRSSAAQSWSKLFVLPIIPATNH